MNAWAGKLRLRATTVNWHLALLVLVVGVCAAPFLGQPFHIDDNFYMDMARNARVNPCYPNDTPYVFEGRSLPDMASHSHPPLQTYFLAMLQKCFGEGPGKERVYHSCALIYPILAVVSFYFLSARFVARPLWPALALACSPLFLVMQHNLMTDVPTLAWWLAAVSTFIFAVDSKRAGLYAASAVFQFAAMFTSYQAAALTPLLGFYLIRMRGGRRGWLALAAPLVAMAAWFGMNFLHYHRLILGDTFGYMQSRHGIGLEALGRKLAAVLEYQGWLIIFPFFLLCVLARGLKGRVFGLSLVLAACSAQIFIPRYRFVDKGIFVIGLVTGAFVILRMGNCLLESLRSRQPDSDTEVVDKQFLGLWYFGVLFYCILILSEGSARYLLPLSPPLLLIFFQSLEALEVTEYRARSRPFLSSAMVASGSIVVSLAWGLLLSHADLEFARVYPRAAQEVSRIVGGMDSYYGGEWGFRYYFRQAGFKQLPPDESLVHGGSWLVRPKLALRYEIPHSLESMTMPAQQIFSYELGTPVRLLDRWTPASFYAGGFYTTGTALVPFSISYRALEEVEVRQVNFLVENLPRARIEGGASVRPWPGTMELQEKNYLSILAKPSTRILYPWLANEPLNLELKCGVGMDAYAEGQNRVFKFNIRQLGSGGTVLADFSKSMNPGLRKEDRGWQPVRLLLQRSSQVPLTLELSFDSEEKGAAGTGAFAEAFLRKP
jgi:hypothetical protein